MPILVSTLTDSTLAVGMIAAIWGMGLYLPQMFTANFAERLTYKKPFLMVLSSFGERLPYLIIGLVVFMLAVASPTLTLVLFFLFLGIAAFSAGAGVPAWYDMIAKVIPVQRRGLWAGLGSGLGAMMGIVGAIFVGRILDVYPYPNNFALLFVLAFVFVMISWVGLALNREPPSEIVKEPVSQMQYLRRLPAILHGNENYRRYFITRSVVQFGAMASGFFIVYGSERFALDGTEIGLLTAILIGSQAVMGVVWGLVGDRLGHKMVLTGAAFAMAVAALVAVWAPTAEWLYVTFFMMGAFFAADWVSSLNIILEFCEPEDRPTYIGLTNTLLAPSIILAPLIGGWLATAVGYPGLMITAAVIALIGGVMFLFWVREPRATTP
ncbi:MAG: MFS transporter [Anaerolineales bacterium]|nr:MFS transporter [Anaerolineales bacterium]